MEQAGFDFEGLGIYSYTFRNGGASGNLHDTACASKRIRGNGQFRPCPLPGEPDDENWAAAMFGLPGVDAQVYALAVDRTGELYAGGDFYSAGDAAVQGIARWDGAAWRPLDNLGWVDPRGLSC